MAHPPFSSRYHSQIEAERSLRQMTTHAKP
jgi:hypothetical protein